MTCSPAQKIPGVKLTRRTSKAKNKAAPKQNLEIDERNHPPFAAPQRGAPKIPPRRSRAQLTRTAYHEAGHAIAACHFDYIFEHVTINPIVEDEWTAAGGVVGMKFRYDPLKQTKENDLAGVEEICQCSPAEWTVNEEAPISRMHSLFLKRSLWTSRGTKYTPSSMSFWRVRSACSVTRGCGRL